MATRRKKSNNRTRKHKRGGTTLTNAQIKSVRNSMKNKNQAINTSNSMSQESTGIEYENIYRDPTILRKPEFKERIENGKIFSYFKNSGKVAKNVLGL